MNIETILKAHGIGSIQFPDIRGFKYGLNIKQNLVELQWSNIVSDNFLRTEVYGDTLTDLSELTYDEIVNKRIGRPIYKGILTHCTISTNPEYPWNFKAFNIYRGGGGTEIASKGVVPTTAPFLCGIKIDETNPDPEKAVTYMEDCKGAVPVNGITQNWGSWKGFIDKYLSTYVTLDLSTKRETQQIDPNDWTKTTDGKTAILDGSKGDLMWKVPKLYWAFKREGTDLYIYLSNKRVDARFVCLAHTKGNKEVNYIYYSVMLGTEKDGKLRSIDGGTPTNDKTIGDFRKLCEANGEDVHMLPYYPWLLYQIIILILGRNRDTQAQWGNNQSSHQTNVAKNLSKGMIYGQSAKGSGVNVFIADPWGNQRVWIDGIKYDSNYNILVGTTNFNNNASGYENVGKTSSLSWGGIDKVHGTSKSGFVPTSTSGSTSTHYADSGYVNSGYFPDASGYAGDDSNAGAFCWRSNSASNTVPSLSARIFAYGK